GPRCGGGTGRTGRGCAGRVASPPSAWSPGSSTRFCGCPCCCAAGLVRRVVRRTRREVVRTVLRRGRGLPARAGARRADRVLVEYRILDKGDPKSENGKRRLPLDAAAAAVPRSLWVQGQ